jgi:Phage tail protein
MIVTLNGYTLNDGSNGVDLDVEIDGLDIPPIRTSSGNYSGRDGAYVGAQFYAGRDISLQGKIFNSNITTLESTRSAFQNALKGNSVVMTILTNAGNSYIVYCNLIDFEMPITRDLFSAPFKIELLATDPTIYDNTSGGALTASLSRLVSGGMTTPAVTPWVFTGGGSPTTINNAGTTNVFPTITLTDIMNNPVLTNLTTNQVFSLTGLVTTTGDTVVIDMRQRTVTLNGSSIFGLVGALSNWWYLQPGNNSITLTTPNSGDTVSAVVSWRSGYPGI